MKKFFVLTAIALAACVSTIGCAKKISIEEGRLKIAELAAKGVPDREMSTLKMYIFEMETAKKIGNGGKFKLYQDSLTTAIAAFEEEMNAKLEQAGPFMETLKKACDEKLTQLKGLHLEDAQKLKGPVDSLMQIESQKLYARFRLEEYSNELDTLLIKQQAADSLRNQFVGKWGLEEELKESGNDVFTWTYITMNTDGKLVIEEGKKSRLSDGTVENWAFNMSGTWDLKGDVAYHFVTREKRLHNEFTGINPATGKRETIKHKPYDSTIAKGTKDSYISWTDLNREYKRAPARGGR